MSFFRRSETERLLFTLEGEGSSVTTPFEDWCERHDVDPEALGAWEHFERTVLRTPPAPHVRRGAA